MNDLVTIVTREIGGEKQLAVDGRTLHKRLNVGRDYTSWIKGRIKQYSFVDGQDYELTLTQTGERSNVTAHEYVLSLDMAKELAMVEKNETGRSVRRYFIDCEKQLRNRPSLPGDAMERLRYFYEAMDSGEGIMVQEHELLALVRESRSLVSDLHDVILEKEQVVDAIVSAVEQHIGRKLDQPRLQIVTE